MIKSAIRDKKAVEIKSIREKKAPNSIHSEESPVRETSNDVSAIKKSKARALARNNYFAKLNDNKKAVAANQEKLQKLLQVEQRLTQNIQKNMEKQYELLNSQASTFKIGMTTN